MKKNDKTEIKNNDYIENLTIKFEPVKEYKINAEIISIEKGELKLSNLNLD